VGRALTPESSRAVFLSYAAEDASAAKRICDALGGAGIEVWFDRSELRGGDAWDQKIRRQIRDCALFIAIISANTQARPEGYFRLEWRLADQRTHLMGRSRAFLVPVCVDDTPDVDADAPDSFLAAQWTRLPGGDTSSVFIERVAHLLSMDARAVPAPAHPPVGAPAGTSSARASTSPAHTEVATELALARTREKSIAVLPFVDMSERRDQEYFGDGMAEEILDVLCKVPNLSVIGRTSSFQFKGMNEDLRAIGSKLGAVYIVEGSVRKAGARIRVTAQLIDTRFGTRLWADSYDRDFGDVLVLQGQIATAIARALQITVDSDHARPRRQLQSAEAYTLYLRGLSAYDRKNDESLLQAQNAFEQALALDPVFLRAVEALGLTHTAQALYESVTPAKAWQRAKEAAEQGMGLDGNSAIAHAVRGLALGYCDFDWATAEAELRKAVALSPRNPIILDFAAQIAHCSGRSEDAMTSISASLALDPLNPYAHTTLAQILLGVWDDAGAEQAYRKGLTISPAAGGNHYHIGLIFLARGKADAARNEFEAEYSIDAKSAGLAMISHARGLEADANAAIGALTRRQGDRWPYAIAQVYAYRGDQERAFEWLDKSFILRDPDFLSYGTADPLFEQLRADPRYKALRRRMKLPE
jgi:TolB-like protein